MKAVHRGPTVFQTAGVNEVGQHTPNSTVILEILWRLMRQHFDLPPPEGSWTDHVSTRTRGAAILHGARGQFDRVPNPSVHHQPPFIKGQILDGRLELFAHDAGSPIRCDEIARLQCHAFAI